MEHPLFVALGALLGTFSVGDEQEFTISDLKLKVKKFSTGGNIFYELCVLSTTSESEEVYSVDVGGFSGTLEYKGARSVPIAVSEDYDFRKLSSEDKWKMADVIFKRLKIFFEIPAVFSRVST